MIFRLVLHVTIPEDEVPFRQEVRLRKGIVILAEAGVDHHEPDAIGGVAQLVDRGNADLVELTVRGTAGQR